MGTLAAAAAAVFCAGWGTSSALAAATPTTWCGGANSARDRKPDLLAGRQIEVVYAHPADAPDRFADLASPIARSPAARRAPARSISPT